MEIDMRKKYPNKHQKKQQDNRRYSVVYEPCTGKKPAFAINSYTYKKDIALKRARSYLRNRFKKYTVIEMSTGAYVMNSKGDDIKANCYIKESIGTFDDT
jgi:hypothetical protein